MFKRLRKPITTKQTMKIVYLLNKTKKFLAIIGMLGIVWSSGPMQYLNAMTSTSDSYEIIEMDTITNENTLPSYPTTTDPDFDPSKVAIESEVLDERTATTKTFRKIDGTYELAMYNDIIHFQENGEWVQVDNSLNDLGEELATNKNKFNIKFPKSLDDNKRIKLTMDNYSIDWSVLNISSSSIEVENEEVTPNNIKELLNITQSVLYRDIQNSVDIEYIVTGSKVKENIILNQYIEDFSMTFEYKLKDLALIEDEDGNIVFINENSEEVFVFSDLFMIDNDMNESFDIEFTLVETGNKTYEITITPSDEWLQSAVYPVMIDPSISYNTNPSEITYYDTYVREKYPTSNYSSQSYIKTGYTTIDQRYYGLMYFYIPTPIRGKEITYAYYNLYASSSNLDDVIYAYENTETFTAGSVTWNTIPEYDTVNIIDHTYIGSSHYHSFDLTNVVQKWNDQGLSRVPGITLKKYREAEGSITTFYSEENSITSKRPTFTFGYIDSEGIKDYWTYNSQQVEEAGVGLVSDFTGLLTFTREDTNFTTEKQSLGISMIYDVTSSTSDIGYGDGWKTNYNMSLILDTTLNLWYTIDGTGNKVHYYQTTCDGREYQGTYTMNTCYIAEDGSQNLLIMRSDYGYLSNRYILTLDQIAYNFGTDEYLDSVSNTKFNLGISITRNTTNKNHIEQITDDSGNEIVLDYNGGSRVDNIQLRIKDGVNYHTLERIEYSYNASGRLTTVTYKSDYDEQGLQTSHVVSYDYDTSYRLDTVISNSGAKLLYFYETGNNRIAKIESYKVNGTSNYKFSEVNYEYNFRQTKISDNNGDYILYSFDGFGHTISILDNDGVSQHFKYINPLTCVIDMDPTNGDENDISYQICKDQEPNYFWNNKKIAESSPQITIQNPINNHSFEYDSPSTDENWDFVIDDMAGSTSAPFSSYNTTRSVYGEKSAYIYVYTGQKAHLEQTVVLDQGNGYTLSGFVYGSSSDNTYFTATVGTTTYTSNIVSDMGEWKYVELVFDVPSDSTEVLVKLFNNNSGYSYFDNIQLVNGFRDTRKNVIDNSSFELENATGELDGWYFSDGNVFLDNVPYYMQDNYEFLLGQKAIKIWNPGTTLKYASYGLDDFNYNTSEAYNIVVGSWAGISMTTQSSRLLTDDYDKVFRIRVDYMSAKRTAGASDYDDYLITSSYIDFDSSAEGLQYVLTELLVPLNTAYINLRYEYSCTGIVYFDNLQVYEKPVFTKYYYDDETGQRTSVAKPSGETIESVYDTMDNMPTNVIVKDANGDQVADVDTTLSVDYYATEVAVNNVKSTPTYNSFGQVTSMKIGDATTYFTTSTSYNSNSNQYVYYTKDEHSKYTYYYYNDLTGLLDQIRDANSNDTTYEYYSDGKLKKVKNIDYCDGSDCAEVSYIYDEDRLEQIVLENGYYYELTYDDQDRIINVNINNSNESYYNELMGYTYEMDGSYYTNRISTQNYKNGDSLKFEYNEKDQIEYIKFKENGGSTYYTRFQYEYDHKG